MVSALEGFHCKCIIRESVDSLCRDETDDTKAFWIAYCVSGVVFYP